MHVTVPVGGESPKRSRVFQHPREAVDPGKNAIVSISSSVVRPWRDDISVQRY